MARPANRLVGTALVLAAITCASRADEPLSGRELHARLLSSCAWVLAGSEGRGTGWLIDAQRKWLVTNYHVIGDAKTVDVVFPVWRDGRLVEQRDEYIANLRAWKIEGKVLRRDPAHDLALIELPALPAISKALPLATAEPVPGDPVLILGNRRDLEQMWALTFGSLRQLYRSGDGYAWRTHRLARGCRLLALQAPINEGDSGGPVVNARGEVIGMAAAILWQTERAAAAIDVGEILKFVFPQVPPAQPAKPDRGFYHQLVHSAAMLQTPSSTSRSTAFVMDKSRCLLLTTAESVGPHERVELVFPIFEKGELIAEAGAYEKAVRIKAGVVVRDTRRNLALLEAASLPDGTAEMSLAKEPARPGDALHSIGNPTGIDALWLYAAYSVRQTGTVQLSSNKEDGASGVVVLQGPGSAKDGGGPIVDAKGRLVAVAGGKDGPEQQVCYAVDLTEIRGFLDANRSKWAPKTADDFHRRGQRRMRIRQNGAALEDFQQTLRLQPGHAGALLDLPDLYRRLGDRDKALAIIREALKSLPPAQCAVPQAQWAAWQTDGGKLDEALKQCNQALMIDAKCARAFAQRAEIWRRKKDLKQALADADEAAWIDANQVRAYFHRGLIHLDRHDWDAAIGDFTRVAELDPFEPAALQERARAFEEKGELEKAKRDRAAAKRLE
jgi:S1-C subfamily serine protease